MWRVLDRAPDSSGSRGGARFWTGRSDSISSMCVRLTRSRRRSRFVRGAAARDRRPRPRRGRERADGSSTAATASSSPSRRGRCAPHETFSSGRPGIPKPTSISPSAGAAVRGARARRASSAGSSGSSCCPIRRSFASAPAGATSASGARSPSIADLRSGDFSSTRTTASGALGSREGGRRRHALLPLLAFRGEDRCTFRTSSSGRSEYIAPTPVRPTLEARRQGGQNLKPVRARASVLSTELIALCSASSGPGRPTSSRTVARTARDRFPYRETEDQARAIEAGGVSGGAAAEDRSSARCRLPEDRVAVGPPSGRGQRKQTLVLCPTDDPREQHWNTSGALPRLPGRSRGLALRSPPDEQILSTSPGGRSRCSSTHRVLSRDVIPKDLGLVILDEEQRFGVAQKELLRSLRLEVDVLALSATPIPRTLHMSLSGLRDISIIETPPEGRRPIRTTVGEYDEELVKTALEREIERGGRRSPHNRVETIEEAAEAAAALPEAALHRRARAGEGARAREKMPRVPARRRDVLSRRRSSVGHRNPAGEHADRRARRRARALPALPDPRPRRPLGRDPHAYLLYPDAMELSPEAGHGSRRCHNTGMGAGFRSRCATSRSAARRPARAEQSGHVAGSASSSTSRCSRRPVAELPGQRRSHAAGAVDAASTPTCRRPTSLPRRSDRHHRRSRSPSGRRAARAARSARGSLGRYPSRSSTCSRSRRRS